MIVDCTLCGAQNRVPADRLGDRAVCGKCKRPLEPTMRPIAIRSLADFDEVLAQSEFPVLVDFWAEWCGPCRAVAPELEKLARAESVTVVKVDTDALPALASRFGISTIPTIVLFRSGREQRRVSGALSASALARAFGFA
jgi:thioredoxin 2